MAQALRAGRGGILGLIELIRAHADAVEADFVTHHRTDLRDLFIPGSGLTVRRTLVLLRALPTSSVTKYLLADAMAKAEEQAKVDRIRARQDYYRTRDREG
jgi:hypothetical protein